MFTFAVFVVAVEQYQLFIVRLLVWKDFRRIVVRIHAAMLQSSLSERSIPGLLFGRWQCAFASVVEKKEPSRPCYPLLNGSFRITKRNASCYWLSPALLEV